MEAAIEGYGFIVIDEKGALFGSVRGNQLKVLHDFIVSHRTIPFENRLDHQHAVRLKEKRLSSYLRRTAEFAYHFFTNPSTNTANVSEIILVNSGPTNLTTELNSRDVFDPCLPSEIRCVVEVNMGNDSLPQRSLVFKAAVEKILPAFFH